MVEMVRDRFLSAIVCCDIDPEREDCFDALDEELKEMPNGTTGGWKALRPDNWRFTTSKEENPFATDNTWEECKPRPCADLSGRWHYVVIT